MPAIPAFNHSLFLEGPAGVGKTSAMLDYVHSLLDAGVAGNSILILLPASNYISRIQDAFSSAECPDVGTITAFYKAQLKQYLPALEPEISIRATDPLFINDPMARFYLLKIAEPYIESGLFQGIRLSKSRIVNQIFQIRQQALLNSVPLDVALQHLIAAAPNRKFYPRIYQAIAQILEGYEDFCREKDLLDSVSQQLLFTQKVLERPDFRQRFTEQYRCLVADNIEEMSEFNHHFFNQIIGIVENTFVVYDQDAGYRDSAWANPINVTRLRKICRTRQTWKDYVHCSPGITALIDHITVRADANDSDDLISSTPPAEGYEFVRVDYYPQMISECLSKIQSLVKDSNISPANVAVLVPYLTDSLELVLKNGLADLGIHSASFVSSHHLNQDPFVRAILSIIALTDTNLPQPSRADIAQLAFHLIYASDPLRADLLAQHTYKGELLSFDNVSHRFQERITLAVGQAYEKFRLWLRENTTFAQKSLPSVFLETLFNDFLNQPDYRFFHDTELQHIALKLIEQAQQFEQTSTIEPVKADLSRIASFFSFMQQDIASEPAFPGVLGGILITDPYTLLCHNQSYAYQFWLDIGHALWSRRPHQDLVNPVAIHSKSPHQVTDEELSLKLQRDQLQSVLLGLLRRCQEKVILLAYGNQEIETNRLIFDLLGNLQKRSNKPS